MMQVLQSLGPVKSLSTRENMVGARLSARNSPFSRQIARVAPNTAENGKPTAPSIAQVTKTMNDAGSTKSGVGKVGESTPI